jgi:glycosyltransferase involved in cell wall biosynthesis
MNILSVELRPLMKGEPWSFGITSKPVWDYLRSQGHTVISTPAEEFHGKQATDKLNNADVVLYQNTELIKPQYYIPQKSVIRLGGIHKFNVTKLKSCHSVIVTNKALWQMMITVRHNCTYIVPNGIELDKHPLTSPPDDFIVGYAAHSQRAKLKGFDLVYSACQKACVRLKTAIYPDTYFPPERMYEDFYSKISCLVLPSSSEGCSNVVMEALAYGVPVITTITGYHGDCLAHLQNCIFITRDENHIAECISRLKNDATLYDTLRKNGRQFAEEHHDHKKVAEQYLEVFNTVPKEHITITTSKREIKEMPNVLLMADREGWAYDNRCQALKQHLSNEFNFDIAYFNQKPVIDYDKYDLIYFAGYMLIGQGRAIPRQKIVASLAGMVSYSPEEAARYINQACACSVFNHEHFAAVFPHTDTELFYIPNGVDVELFKPAELPEELIIGWAGNSKHKGKRLDKLQAICKKLNVKLIIQDRDVNYIPHTKMPEFYRQLSCFCCVSESEGSNNGILEAAACGVPILTTPCGNYNAIVQNDGGLILRDDLSDLELKINLMQNSHREAMGEKLRLRILGGWSWRIRAGEYKEMFQHALQTQ